MKAIPTSLHAYLDYGSAVLFLIAPWIFLFDQVQSAKLVSLFVGIMIVLMSLLTRYEGGLYRLIPMRVHLSADVIVGLFLIASPWLLDFANETYLFHVTMGLVAMISGICTKRYVKTDSLAVQG